MNNNYFTNIFSQVEKYNQNLDEYKKVAKDITNPTIANNNIAMRLIEEKDYEKALEILEKTKAMGVEHPLTYMNLGTIYANLSIYEKAVPNLRHAIKLDKEAIKARLLLASIYQKTNELSLARKIYKEAIKYDGKNALVVGAYAAFLAKCKKYDESEKEFEKAVLCPNANESTIFYWGLMLLQKNELSRAMRLFLDALKINPIMPEANYFAAMCAFKLKDYKNAIVFAAKTIALQRKKIDPRIILAESLLKEGKGKDAIRVYEKAEAEIREIKYYSNFYLSFGISLQKLQKWNESIFKLEHALKINDSDIKIYHALSESYFRLKNDLMGEKMLFEALLIDEKDVQSYIMLGKNCENNKEYRLAIKYFEKGLKLDKKNITILFELAYSYQMLKDHKKAIKYYNQLLDIDPNMDEAKINIANSYSEIGDFKNAIRKVRSTYKLYKNELDYLLMYAYLLHSDKQFLNAKEKFEEALKISPKNVSAIFGRVECLAELNKIDEAQEILKYYEKTFEFEENYLNAKLVVYLKMYENEKKSEYKETAKNICDKIILLFGKTEKLAKIKQQLGENEA